MEAGDLRVFTNFTIAPHGRMFMEGQAIVLLRPDSHQLPYRRWYVLVDGDMDLCDEDTMNRNTIEAR